VLQWHLRSETGAALGAQLLRYVHRRDRAGAEFAASSRQAQRPVIVAYGTLETPEFQRQSRDFSAAVKAAGKPVQLLVAEGHNHFEIPETLANPYGLLGRAVLAQMNLSQG